MNIDLAQEQPDAHGNRGEANEIRPLLNEDQIIVSNAVLEALTGNDNRNAKIYFLDRPGGTRKTFTYNYIIKEAWGRPFSVSTRRLV